MEAEEHRKWRRNATCAEEEKWNGSDFRVFEISPTNIRSVGFISAKLDPKLVKPAVTTYHARPRARTRPENYHGRARANSI